MRSNLMMDFSVDKENNTIHVKREFAAPISDVWAAWTKSELLDQWWAPKPWQAKTKTMDFRVGGFWLYAMVGPAGEEHWGRADYTAIEPLKGFEGKDAFCSPEGVKDADMPQSSWKTDFSATSDVSTIVQIKISFETLADLQKNVEMGFKEGFTMALENLDAILSRK